MLMQELSEAGGALKIIKKYGKAKFQQLMDSLSPEAFMALHNDWKFWCNPYQVLPDDPELQGYLMMSGRGTGKALSNDTPILTNTGWKTMGTIQVGDKVFDERGDTCNVTAKYRQKKELLRKTYKLDLELHSKGKSSKNPPKITINCCGDHLWGVLVNPRDVNRFYDWVDIYTAKNEYHIINADTIKTLLSLGKILKIPHAAPINFESNLSWSKGTPHYHIDPNNPLFDERYLLTDNVSRMQALVLLLKQYCKADIYSDKPGKPLIFTIKDPDAPIDIILDLIKFAGESVRKIVNKFGEMTYVCTRQHSNLTMRENRTQELREIPSCWYITAINECEYQDVGYTCITVDSPNSLFLCTKELIPTHNTWTGANWTIQRAKEERGNIAIVGETRFDVMNILIDRGPSSIRQISKPDFMPKLFKEDRILEWPNGVVAYLYFGDEIDQTRGFSGETIWADELAKYKKPQEFWSNIIMGMREGSDPKFLITTTPRPIDMLKKMYYNPAIHKIKASTHENRHNLHPRWFAELLKEYDGTDEGRQEIYGEILWEAENSVFKRKDIDAYRIKPENAPHDYDYVVIGVDPAVTNHKKSDETGIIVAGCKGNRRDRHAFVLEDCSGKYSVKQWVDLVVSLTKKYKAEYIVVETNQGGMFVIHPLLEAGIPLSKIREVKATKGKVVRAQPIGLIMQQGRLHHVGMFTQLEDELSAYDGDPNMSPNRFDAYVWAMSHFFDANGTGEFFVKDAFAF